MFFVDWNKVNVFAFFPPLFSILVLLAGLGKTYLRRQIQHAAERGAIVSDSIFVENIALGWAVHVSFINAMIASFFSSISVWSPSRSFMGLTLTAAFLALIFMPMLWYLFSHEPDQIVSEPLRGTPYTVAFVCKIVLVLVNFILVGIIFWNQQRS